MNERFLVFDWMDERSIVLGWDGREIPSARIEMMRDP